MVYNTDQNQQIRSTNSSRFFGRQFLITALTRQQTLSVEENGEIPLKKWFRKWGVLAFFILLLVGLGTALLAIPIPHIKDEFTHALGHALIIAGILIAPVDYYVKKHLVKEASIDIAQYLVGFPLPEEIRPKLVGILDSKIVTRNTQLNYKILPIEGDLTKIKLEVERTYEVQNVSPAPYRLPVYMTFEKHANPTVKESWCMASDGSVSKHKVDFTPTEPETGVLKFDLEEVVIKPQTDNPNLKYRFGWKYSYIYPNDFNEHFFFMNPAIGVIVTVECPPEYEFYAPSTPIRTETRWEYTGAFLIGEQIGVRWRKKNPQPHQPATVEGQA